MGPKIIALIHRDWADGDEVLILREGDECEDVEWWVCHTYGLANRSGGDAEWIKEHARTVAKYVLGGTYRDRAHLNALGYSYIPVDRNTTVMSALS